MKIPVRMTDPRRLSAFVCAQDLEHRLARFRTHQDELDEAPALVRYEERLGERQFVDLCSAARAEDLGGGCERHFAECRGRNARRPGDPVLGWVKPGNYANIGLEDRILY